MTISPPPRHPIVDFSTAALHQLSSSTDLPPKKTCTFEPPFTACCSSLSLPLAPPSSNFILKNTSILKHEGIGNLCGSTVWQTVRRRSLTAPVFSRHETPPPFYNHLLSSVFICLHASVVSASLSRLLIIISVCARLYLILAPLLTLLVSALHELRCLPQTPQIREGFFFFFFLCRNRLYFTLSRLRC